MRASHCLLALCLFSASLAQAQPSPLAAPASSSVIGQVGGRTVRDTDVSGRTQRAREDSLRALFVGPALRAYLETHRRKLEPSEVDIDHYIAVLRQRERCGAIPVREVPPDQERAIVRMMAGNLKVQRFIHLSHGGGRILFQQMGLEAYDATRRLLLDLERQGAMTFATPEIRQAALGYWLEDPAMGLLPDPGPDAFLPEQALNPCPAR